MKTLQDVVMIFHDSAECPGIITSDENGWLVCAECGQTVGQVDPRVLQDILNMIDQNQKPRTG